MGILPNTTLNHTIWLVNSFGQSMGLGWEARYLLWEPENFQVAQHPPWPTSGIYLPLSLPQSHHSEGKLATEQGQVALSLAQLESRGLPLPHSQDHPGPHLHPPHSGSWVGSRAEKPRVQGGQGGGRGKGWASTYCTDGRCWRSCRGTT